MLRTVLVSVCLVEYSHISTAFYSKEIFGVCRAFTLTISQAFDKPEAVGAEHSPYATRHAGATGPLVPRDRIWIIHSLPFHHGPRCRLAASRAAQDEGLPVSRWPEELLDPGRGEQCAPVSPLRLFPGGGWSPGHSRPELDGPAPSKRGSGSSLRHTYRDRSTLHAGSHRVAAGCGGQHGGYPHQCDGGARVLPVVRGRARRLGHAGRVHRARRCSPLGSWCSS